MTTEYNPHSTAAKFWRDAYLAAFNCGHKDPEAAADEAFMAFESRFGVYTEEEESEALCGEQQRADGTGIGAGQHMADGMGIGVATRQFGDRLLGEGPSIEAGDAPQTVESPDGAAHRVLVADLTAHMSLVPKSEDRDDDIHDDGDLG
jgi:hypothetical protein